MFGAESQFEKYLGCKVAAFEVEGYKPRDELVYVMYTEVHQQIGRFTMRGDRTMFLFTFADDDDDDAALATCRLERPCCGDASETAAGDVRAFWTRWMLPTTCISIASARSAWMRGKDCGQKAA